MENRDEMQQMAYFLQAAEEQIKALDAQRQMLDQGIHDIVATLVTLEGLDNTSADPSTGTINTMIPVGAGSFVKTTLTKPKKYFIGIGAQYYTELDFEASSKLLNEQKEKMENTVKIIDSRIQQLVEQAEKVRPVLEQQLETYQRQGSPGPSMPPSKINLDDI